MDYLEVNGGKVLKGEVKISGAKNAAISNTFSVFTY